MIYDQQKNLLIRLLTKARKGELSWKPAISKDTFQISFRDNSVIISQKLNTNAGAFDYIIRIANGDGVVVDEFSDDQLARSDDEIFPINVTWYQDCHELYDRARRSALGADKILSEILGELEDDLPF